MEKHKLAVPLCALEVASSQMLATGCIRAAAAHSSSSSVLGKQHTIPAAAQACSDTPNSDFQTSAISSPNLPLVSVVELKGEHCSGHRTTASSSAGPRCNSSFLQAEGGITSTSPDGSYISSPFFSGSPMDFPETLQPRALNIAADMQCSLSTPLEKFFDVLDSTDTPVATPSPLATVCTQHTTSPAADAFPLNGAGAQEAEELEKGCNGGQATRASSEGLHGNSAFPIRPTEHSSQKDMMEEQRQSLPVSRRSSTQGETSRTTTCAESSDSGLVEGGGVSHFSPTKAVESALHHSVSNGTTRGELPEGKPVSADDIGASDADRLLVDFQLLLILLFDQVCRVVPGLRRQDGGAFYSMHLQRIAAGPLHPTLESYADVLLPICSAMNFFSDSKSNEQQGQKHEERDGILSVALRYLARHGTVAAAPIAEMVAKCPAGVFIQVVSALECMYSLQRILVPGASEPRGRVSPDLDPKTIWGGAVTDMEKAACVLAEECMSSSVPPKSLPDQALTHPSPSLDQPIRQPKRPAAAEFASSRRQLAGMTSTVMHETELESHGTPSSSALPGLSLAELNATAISAPSGTTLPSGAADGGVVADARGEVSPAFISASVNKRRHPNVQAEILNSCCPERLAQRGTRLLGEVLQKLQCEQSMRPASAKTQSPKQAFNTSLDHAEAPVRQQDAGGVALLAEQESDSLSSGSTRGKRKLSGAGEQSLGEALAQLAAIQQTTANSSQADMEEMQAGTPTDGQLKKHGYALRKGGGKRGKKTVEDASAKGHARLTPGKAQNPQQTRAKTAAPLSPSEGSQQDPSASLPPSLTEQLMRLAKGADGDFPAALSSTMRGVFFNRSLNRWVCTWSRNGKEYQRSWSAGKYGYETARGLAMHCRLEKLLSGEAHTLQKGMLAVFKPIINSPASPPAGESTGSSKPDTPVTEEAERRKSEVPRPRSSPRPANRLESATRETESQFSGIKSELSREATAAPRTHTGSTYSDMLTLMSQAICRNPEAFSFEGEATEAAVKTGDSRGGDEIKELADPSVGEHFLAAVAAAAAACDVPGFED